MSEVSDFPSGIALVIGGSGGIVRPGRPLEQKQLLATGFVLDADGRLPGERGFVVIPTVA